MRTLFLLLVSLPLSLNLPAQIVLKTNYLELSLNPAGHIAQLTDRATGRTYAAPGTRSPLLAVYVGVNPESPSKASYNPKSKTLTLQYPRSKATLTLRVEEREEYLVFELIKAQPEMTIDKVIWGPYATNIGETVGEIVGVVRNGEYALGIQSLNVKTVGGFPSNEEGFELARGSAAQKTPSGSVLQAYSLNRSKARNITVWDKSFPNMPVPAIPGETVRGSKIALFGCPEPQVLAVISKIEVEQGLPHPLIDGVWAKISPQTGRSYLIANYSESTIDTLLEYTQKAGLMSLYHMDAFKSWGHYELSPAFFPNGVAGMQDCVKKATQKGIHLGAHTLTNFIQTHDPYVTPVPDKRLAKTGFSRLTAAIDSTATVLPVESPEYFANTHANWLHTVVIGEELIRYKKVSDEAPWRLLDCERGAFGTKKAAHSAGAEVGKLLDHPYEVFYPNLELQTEIALNLARRFNESGLSHLDFDGHEGCLAAGQGDYGIDLFAETFIRNTAHPVINGTSLSKHFYWHINTYCNWGEPWYGGFAESMQEYRINNQALLERNYLPNMLGWYLLTETTTLADMEWMLARAAGYNAGFAMATSLAALKNNPQTDDLLLAIRDWEQLRRARVFSEAQRERLKIPANEFRLVRTGENTWDLFPFHKSPEFVHEKTEKQPGEPTDSRWTYEMPDGEQFFQFKLSVKQGEGTVKNPVFKIDNYTRVELPVELFPGEACYPLNDRQIRIMDDKGRQKKILELAAPLPLLSKGGHVISFNAQYSGTSNHPHVAVYFKSLGAPEGVRLP